MIHNGFIRMKQHRRNIETSLNTRSYGDDDPRSPHNGRAEFYWQRSNLRQLSKFPMRSARIVQRVKRGFVYHGGISEFRHVRSDFNPRQIRPDKGRRESTSRYSFSAAAICAVRSESRRYSGPHRGILGSGRWLSSNAGDKLYSSWIAAESSANSNGNACDVLGTRKRSSHFNGRDHAVQRLVHASIYAAASCTVVRRCNQHELFGYVLSTHTGSRSGKLRASRNWNGPDRFRSQEKASIA